MQAVANGQELGATDSAIGASVNQTNSATVTANGGVVMGDVTDQGSFVAIAAGNNLTSASQGASSQTLDVNQANTGAVTQGAVFANFGQSEITDTSAIATGNNANITNTEGGLAVTTAQDNESFVHGQAVETSFDWGGATATAEAVGNSVVAANVGPSLALNNAQLNGAQGVESSASFQGDTGFDAFVQFQRHRQLRERLCLLGLRRGDERHQQPDQPRRRSGQHADWPHRRRPLGLRRSHGGRQHRDLLRLLAALDRPTTRSPSHPRLAGEAETLPMRRITRELRLTTH